MKRLDHGQEPFVKPFDTAQANDAKQQQQQKSESPRTRVIYSGLAANSSPNILSADFYLLNNSN